MDSKDRYSETFLKAANISYDQKTIDHKRTEWWQNVRSKNSGGLRLTDQGLDFIQNHSKIKTYNIKFPKEVKITPQVLIWLDQFIECPYHVTKKDITVLTEIAAFELYMFSGDVQKMGASKAMAKRYNQESV